MVETREEIELDLREAERKVKEAESSVRKAEIQLLNNPNRSRINFALSALGKYKAIVTRLKDKLLFSTLETKEEKAKRLENATDLERTIESLLDSIRVWNKRMGSNKQTDEILKGRIRNATAKIRQLQEKGFTDIGDAPSTEQVLIHLRHGHKLPHEDTPPPPPPEKDNLVNVEILYKDGSIERGKVHHHEVEILRRSNSIEKVTIIPLDTPPFERPHDISTPQNPFIRIDGIEYLANPELINDPHIPTRDKILKDDRGNLVKKGEVLRIEITETLKISDAIQ